MKAKIAALIATFLNVGNIRYAPGTFGSLATIPILILMRRYPGFLPLLSIFVLCLGIWAADIVAKKSGLKDPSKVVIDEVCGMMVSFLWIPITAATLVWGFLLFRLFDILKPPPIKRLEKLPGGYGIMLDDVLAGVYVNLILRVVLIYA